MHAEAMSPDRLRHIRLSGSAVETPCRQARPGAARPGSAAKSCCEEEPIHELAAYVLGRSGLNASVYRCEPLQRRVPACVRALQAGTPEHALEILKDQPHLLPLALSSLLIGVSEFFRDAAVFAYLWRIFSESARDRRKRLRILSVACADGAELYSVAIFLDEMRLLDRCRLHGTDCRSAAIQLARNRLYPHHALDKVDEPTLNRYFRPDGALFRLLLPGRARIDWEVGDAFAGSAEEQWDVILCRNLAIYLKPEACRRLWTGLARRLRPEGRLIVGRAERPVVEGLTLLQQSIYQKGMA